MTDRTVLRVSGKDRESFLQGLVSNDVKGLKDGLVYAALLTPQGKYLADFLLVPAEDAILIDVATDLARSLAQRLTMYKLRADVSIEATDITPARGLGDAPVAAFADPRHAALGWRAYDGRDSQTGIDWDALRVAHCIPETGIELTGDSYLLEAGFEHLNGVEFRKGCYVGQEVTARMKHKTELKKGLATVSIEGEAPVGTAITRDGKPVGTLFTQSGDQAIAYLRFDRAGSDMQAGDAVVNWKG
ncbi:folate-binding protein YgfZ [Aliiroseovarius sp. PrR006]|uniref:CAF17-like 4Fe-4S cluster assembly/insertion protein YgfZ n=1 Tax=Aliiroseovarius sp. PrR006 TaxID=2706883 RepID=UPI0013CF68D4|nr:folate-binding protein YgfZ [Aliiroseovarius sp. PrR006]NDW53597.1 folate-binding protein YgfZ [Aliiroseovarius sp. PrR006]